MAASDPLTGLHEVRLPPDMPGQVFADVAAAVGFGLAVAVVLAPLAIWVLRPRPRDDLEARIAELAQAPDSIRVPGLLRLLSRRAPDRARAYGPALYRPGGLPEAAEVERALRERR